MKSQISLFVILTFLFSNSQAVSANIGKKEYPKLEWLQQDQAKQSDGISNQLDLAMEIHQKQTEEALQITKSALRAAQSSRIDTLEMRAYYILGRISYATNDTELSKAYYDTAFIISDSLPSNWYKGEILFRKGQTQHRLGNYIEALETFQSSIAAARKLDSYKIMGSSYSMIGSIFRFNAMYDRAIENIIKSRRNYEKAGFAEGDAWASYLLGRIYADLKQPQKALEQYEKSLATYNELAAIDGNSGGVALCHEQIGLINLGFGNYKVAQEHIEYVLTLHVKSGSESGISSAQKHLGMIEYSKGNYQLAEEYLQKALISKKKLSDFLSQSGIYEYIGLCMIKLGRPEEGFKNIQRGLEIALSSDQKNLQIDIYEKLQDIYLNLNNLEQVIYYQNKQIEVQDLILSGEANIKMEQLKAIYEIDEKNNEIAELEKEKTIAELHEKEHKTFQMILLVGILLAFIISLTVLLLYNKIRLKNKELNAVNSTKDKLFSILAHDLKGPIGSAHGLSKYMLDEVEQDNKKAIKKYALSISESLNNTTNLLTNLLDWARSQMQRIEFNPKDISLFEASSLVLNTLSTQATNKGISIKTSIESTHRVYADEYMLNTILLNLVSNAIKFSNPDSDIRISSEANDKYIEVFVNDRGIGIDPKIVSQIFMLEANNRKKGTSGEAGTGLGLLLVKEFVEQHGGQVYIQSEVGKGSTFSFTIPLRVK